MDICRICGEEEHVHHDFIGMPMQCLCGHDEWFHVNYEDIPNVCEKFAKTEADIICKICKHPEDCHHTD